MDEVLCPTCGKPNPEDLESCEFCGGRLKPADSKFIQVGPEPVKKDTTDLEKAKPAGSDRVRPGEAPTHKNPADQEKTLPTWLRSLRENKDNETGESTAGNSPGQNLPFGAGLTASPDSSDDQLDWLSGLGKAAAEDEEGIPDWMGVARANQAGTAAPLPASAAEPVSKETSDPSAGTGGTNPLRRGDGQPRVEDLKSSLSQEPGADQEELPDWLQSLQSQPVIGEKTPAASQGDGEPPDWLDSLISESAAKDTAGQPAGFHNQGENLDWLDSMKAQSGLSGRPEQPLPSQTGKSESLPDWLGGLPEIPEEAASAPSAVESAIPAEHLPDWLNELKGKNINSESPQAEQRDPAGESDSTLDWLSDPGFIPATTGIPAGEKIPEWLLNQEDKSSTQPGTPTELTGKEPPVSGIPRQDIPDWISRFQVDGSTAADQESTQKQGELAATPPDNKEDSGPLPDWLAGIRSINPDAPAGTPGLVPGDGIFATGDENETAFSLETPEWLSKIKPEKSAGKNPPGVAEGSPLENPEVSELPSWVQAMRPVESVVAEATPDSDEAAGVTERTGPLAGINGVLPVGPGIGLLSKPPAYSNKLQASEGQQRYASSLESLINSESQPQVVRSTRIASNRLWRWLVSILLILAVSLPLVTNLQISQATGLRSPEMLSAYSLIGSLPPGVPVLVVFDYEPAFSGELEAAATPLMDQLLHQGPRLALISTSPTGPALAERFLTDSYVSPLIAGYGYQPGQQYVDLGYLAGGPSGIQYFASSPAEAAPYTLDGEPAWQLPPMQGVQKLSDFAAVLVLTDNADTGRTWIEQTAATIGSTPLVMVISAQAEPMLLPYYDSGQIKGLVTGLAGGEAYGQTYLRADGQTGPAQHYWNSFSAGILVAESLIVLGALWYAISGWVARRTKPREEA
jgi:hypothetical protein